MNIFHIEPVHATSMQHSFHYHLHFIHSSSLLLSIYLYLIDWKDNAGKLTEQVLEEPAIHSDGSFQNEDEKKKKGESLRSQQNTSFLPVSYFDPK